MAKIVTVFGVNNPLGFSVTKALSSDPSYKVRVVVADGCDASGLSLPPTCDTVNANLCDVRSVRNVIKGAYGAFIVTSSDHTDKGKAAEIQEGKTVADACSAEGLEYVVYCTQLSVIGTLGISARHMDAKAAVEMHMKSLGLPLTCVILPCCYEGLLTVWKPHPVENKTFELTIPMGSTPLDMISVEDAGHVVHSIFRRSNQFLHKTISMSAEKLTIKHMAAILTEQLRPYKYCFTDKQLTIAQFSDLMSQLNSNDKSGEDFANMFDFFIRVDQRCNIERTQELYPRLQTFDQWVSSHRDQIISELQNPLPKLDKYWTTPVR